MLENRAWNLDQALGTCLPANPELEEGWHQMQAERLMVRTVLAGYLGTKGLGTGQYSFVKRIR